MASSNFQTYNILQEESSIQKYKKTMVKFYEDLDLGYLKLKDLYMLKIQDYLKYMGELPFEEQHKNIKKYLKWYFDFDDFDIFASSIISQRDYDYINLVLSPNGQRLALYDFTMNLIIFDLAKNEEIVRFRKKNIRKMVFTFDSKKIVFSNEEGVFVFDSETHSFEKKHETVPKNFFLSKTMSTFAIFYEKNITVITESKTVTKTENSELLVGDFTKKFPEIFCFSTKNELIIWNFLKNEVLSTIQTRTELNILCFSDDGSKVIASSSQENSIKIIFFPEPINYTKFCKILELKNHADSPNFLEISADGESILSAEDAENQGQKIFLWKWDKIKSEYSHETIFFEYYFKDFKWSQNKFIGVNSSNEIHYFEPFKPCQKKEGITRILECIYSPIEDYFLSRVGANTIALINEKSGLLHKYLIPKNKEEPDPYVLSYFFSSDGSKAVLLSFKFLYIYEVKGKSDSLICNPIRLKETSDINILIMSKKGVVVTGHAKGEINIYQDKANIKTYDMKTLEKTHLYNISALAFNFNEELLASGDGEGNLRFWNKDFEIIKEKFIKGDEFDGWKDKIEFLLFSKQQKQTLFILFDEKFKIYDFQQNAIIFSYNIRSNIARTSLDNKTKSFLSISDDECFIYVYIPEFSVSTFKKINENYKFQSHKKGIPHIVDIKCHRKDRNRIFFKCPCHIYEVNNAIETKTIELDYSDNRGNVYMIEKVFWFLSQKEGKSFIKIFDSKTGDLMFPHLKNKCSDNFCYLALLSANQKNLLLKSHEEYWVWNLEKNLEDKVLYHGNEKGYLNYTSVGMQKCDEKFITFVKDYAEVYLWENNKSPFEKKIFHSEKKIISTDFSFNDKNLLVVCEDRLFFFETGGFKQETEIVFSEIEIIEQGLYSWSSDSKIFLTVTVNQEKIIKVLNGKNGVLEHLYKPSFGDFSRFIVEPTESFLLLIYKDKLSIYNPNGGKKDQEKIIMMTTDIFGFELIFVNKNGDLYVIASGKVKIYYNFMENSVLFLINRDNCKTLITKKQEGNNENYHNVVFPFNFNVLQIYAYEKTFMTLKNLLQVRELPLGLFFFKDIHERNCFDIISETKESKLFLDFLNYIMQNYSIQKLAQAQSSQVLPEGHCFDSKFFKKLLLMFEDDPKTIASYLDYIFTEPTHFPPNFTYLSLKQPIITSESEPVLTEIKLKEMYTKNKSCIDEEASMNEIVNAKCLFSDSLMDYDNKDTIDVFKQISDFDPTNEIFSHVALTKILEYKWELYAKRIYFFEALSFVIFLGIYLLNANFLFILRIEEKFNDQESNTYIFSLVIDVFILICIVLHIYQELKQILTEKILRYFSSIWNAVDVILIILSFTTTILDIISCLDFLHEFDFLKTMHAFTIFFIYIRIISFARGIEGSSFMIKLIIQVIWDIRYFLLLMFIFIVALSSSVFVIQSNFNYNLFEVFIAFFRQMIGDLGDYDEIADEVNYSWTLYCFFFASTILLTISMLNLLIAIISDTFSRVKNAESLTKIWERWNIITEIDEMISAKNSGRENFKNRAFLFFVYNDRHTKEETTDFKDLKKYISIKMEEFQENYKKNFEDYTNKTEEKFEELRRIMLQCVNVKLGS